MSPDFRYQLRQEAQNWQTDGLITPTQFQQLAERYQFDRLEINDKNRFTQVLIGLGCVLIGLGVSTSVAANWQDIPRGARVALLLGLFISVNFAGFRFWRSSRDQWQHRLGQGLLLMGSLLLGANMALMAQMFHLGGSAHELFLTWGIGVLLMSYSLRLTSLGMLAVLLVGVGYWSGWSETNRVGELSTLSFIVQQMPLAAGVLYLPLAYRCRSRVLFVFTAIAVTSSIVNSFVSNLIQSGWLLAVVSLLPAALFWGYDDRLWTRFSRREALLVSRPFQRLARGFALLFLGILLYLVSFQSFWTVTQWSSPTSPLPEWRSLPSVLILCVLTIVEWVYLVRSGGRRSRRRRLNLNTAAVGGMVVITALLLYWHTEVGAISIFAAFVSNALLALLGMGTIRESLGTGDRRPFWFGIVLLTMQILSRLLEYETGLLLKSLVFVLCGVGVIAAGLWFERYAVTIAPSLPEESQ